MTEYMTIERRRLVRALLGALCVGFLLGAGVVAAAWLR